MIELTRLNGHSLIVNCHLLKFAEASPDTVLTLTTGEKVVVLETCAQVMQLALRYQASLLGAAWPDAAAAIGALHTLAARNDAHPDRMV